MMKKLLLAALLFVAGCAAFFGSKLPNDIQQETKCIQNAVEAGETNVFKIGLDCSISELQLLIDGLGLLLDSKDWTAAHPDLVPHAQAMLHDALAKRAENDNALRDAGGVK